MWLPWYYGAMLMVSCASISYTAVQHPLINLPGVVSVFREAAVLSALYTAWRIVGRLSVIHPEGAFTRADWLWDLERWLRVPDEQAWQAVILEHSWLVKAANIYYGGAHVPLMGVFLVWMFFRHRDAYPPWRNLLATSTIACVLIQLLPLAPPRLMPEFGLIDTPHLYAQSVYPAAGAGLSGQLQAMPSIHVLWAALIAWAMLSVDRGWVRWLGLAHLLATSWVVVVTGNHYWLDGAVAIVVLVICWIVLEKIRVKMRRSSIRPESRSEVPVAVG